MGLLDDPSQFIQDRVASWGRYVLPFVRPLAVPDENDDPDPAGSCVLLWYRGTRYLVSAAHVLDEYHDRFYYIGTQTAWRKVPGPFTVTRVPAGSTHELDHLDFGFRAIDHAEANQWDGCAFLTADQLADGHRPVFDSPRRSKYLLVGYPLDRFEKLWSTTIPGNLAFTGAIAPVEQFRQANLPPDSHILLEWDPDEVVGPSGHQSSPRMLGMSGGGIFLFPSVQLPGIVERPSLAAIAIEQRKTEHLLVGVRIDVVLQGIRLTTSGP